MSEREMSCIVPSSPAGEFPVVVSVLGIDSNHEQCSGSVSSCDFHKNEILYEGPAVHSVTPSNGYFDGGYIVKFNGGDYGDVKSRRTATIGGKPCGKLEYVSRTEMKCTVPPGDVGDALIVVSVDGVPSLDSEQIHFTYLGPEVTRVAPSTGPVYGGTPLRIMGRNLGKDSGAGAVSIWLNGAKCIKPERVNEHEVKCVSPPGVKAETVAVAVLIGSENSLAEKPDFEALCQSSTNPCGSFSYIAPVVRAITPISGPVYGGSRITITGTNLGNEKHQPNVHIDGNDCVQVHVESNSLITCTTSDAGIPKENVSVIVVQKGVSSEKNDQVQYSFVSPSIFSIAPARSATSGGTRITLTGNHFGSPDMDVEVTLGDGKCSDVKHEPDGDSNVPSHSRVSCITSAHRPGLFDSTLAVQGHPSTKPGPQILFEGPEATAVSPLRGGSYGYETIKVYGHHFGVDGSEIVVKVGGKKCLGTHRLSAQLIQCIVPPGNPGPSSVIVYADGITSEKETTVFFTYDGPSVYFTHPSEVPSYGNSTVHIHGAFFGIPDLPGLHHSVTVGNVPCKSVTLINDHQIDCIVPPGGTDRSQVVVTVNGVASDDMVDLLYVKPTVSRIAASHGSVSGGTVIDIIGQYLGEKDLDVTAYIGKVPCITTTVVNNSKLRCSVPPQPTTVQFPTPKELEQKVHISVRDPLVSGLAQSYSKSDKEKGPTFLYDPIVVAGVEPRSCAWFGDCHVNITGSNFQPKKRSTRVLAKIGDRSCKKTIVHSEHLIECIVPGEDFADETLHSAKKAAKNLENNGKLPEDFDPRHARVISVEYDDFKGVSEEPIFYYEQMQLEEVQPSEGPVYGGQTIRVIGKLFGVNKGDPIVLIDGISCPNSKRISRNEITAETPPGFKAGPVSVRIVAPNDPSAASNMAGEGGPGKYGIYAYSAPNPYQVLPPKAPWGGGSRVAIVGENLGQSSSDVLVTIGSKRCTDVKLLSNKKLTCTVQGGKPNKPLKVSTMVGGVLSSSELTFEYVGVKINSVRPLEVGTAGGEKIVVTGVNFSNAKRKVPSGADKKDIVADMLNVRIGGALCTDLKIINDEELSCNVPPLHEGTHELSIIVLGDRETAVTFDKHLTFSLPVVDFVSPADGPLSGGNTISITGRHLGAAKLQTTVLIGGVPCNSTTFVNSNLVKCVVPVGTTTGNTKITVSVQGELSDGSTMFAYTGKDLTAYEYKAPEIFRVHPPTGPAYGHEVITITGSHFGDNTSSPLVTIQGVPCITSTWIDSKHLECLTPRVDPDLYKCALHLQEQALNDPCHDTKTPCEKKCPGLDGSFEEKNPLRARVAVIFMGKVSAENTQSYYTYEPVEINDISPSSGPAYGGEQIRIRGSNLGSEKFHGNLMPTIMIGPEPCLDLQFKSPTEIVCTTPAFVTERECEQDGSTKPLDLTVGVIGISSPASKYKYQNPEVSSVTPSSASSVGNQHLVIKGKYFGVAGKFFNAEDAELGLPAVFIGDQPCTEVELISSNEIHCLAPAAKNGKNLKVVVQEAGHCSSGQRFPVFFHYLSPTVHGVEPSSGPIYGHTTLTIRGESLDSAINLRKGYGLSVDVGGFPCSNLRPSPKFPGSVLCDTGSVPKGFSGNAPASASSFRFSSLQNSQIENLDVVVSIGALRTKIPSAFTYTAFDVNTVARLKGIGVDRTKGSTTGGYALEVLGKGFAKAAVDAKDLYVSVGSKKCAETKFVTEEKLICIVPEGTGENLDVAVHAYDYEAMVAAQFSYYSPTLLKVSPPCTKNVCKSAKDAKDILGDIKDEAACVKSGNKWEKETNEQCAQCGVESQCFITITGRNFGPSNGDAIVMIGDSPCHNVGIQNHEQIICSAPIGIGKGLPISVTTADDQATDPKSNLVFNYDAPVIESADPSTMDTKGNTVITLLGKNLCVTPKTLASERERGKKEIIEERKQIQDHEKAEMKKENEWEDASEEASRKATKVRLEADSMKAKKIKWEESKTADEKAKSERRLKKQVSFAKKRVEKAKNDEKLRTREWMQQIADERRIAMSKAEEEVINQMKLASNADRSARKHNRDANVLQHQWKKTVDRETVGAIAALDNAATAVEHFKEIERQKVMESVQSQLEAVQKKSREEAARTRHLVEDAKKRVPIFIEKSENLGNDEVKGEPGMNRLMALSAMEGISVDSTPQLEQKKVRFRGKPTALSKGKMKDLKSSNDESEKNIISPKDAIVKINGKVAPSTCISSGKLIVETPPGTGKNVSLSLNVAGQQVSVDTLLAYKAPTILSIGTMDSSGSFKTTGGVLLTLLGKNFSPHPDEKKEKITVGGRNCTNLSVPLNETDPTSVRTCQTPAGVGAHKSIVITVDGLASNPLKTFSYGRPKITKVTPNLGHALGQEKICVEGENLIGDKSDDLPLIEIDGKPCKEVKRDVKGCSNGVQCVTPPGFGETPTLHATLGSQKSFYSATTLFGYRVPQVQSIEYENGAKFAATKGGSTITINGSDFGPPSAAGQAETVVAVRNEPCSNVVVLSDNKIVCKVPPGLGTSVPVTVARSGQRGVGSIFAYAAPEIDKVVPSKAVMPGDEIILIGKNFGNSQSEADQYDLQVKIDDKQCDETRWISASKIGCKVPFGSGTKKNAIVKLSNQTSSPVPVDFHPPIVDLVVPNELSTSGGTELHIHGSVFGREKPASDKDFKIFVNHKPCTNPVWINHGYATCRAPPGAGKDVPVEVQRDGQKSDPAKVVSYEAPVVELIIRTPSQWLMKRDTQVKCETTKRGKVGVWSAATGNTKASCLIGGPSGVDVANKAICADTVTNDVISELPLSKEECGDSKGFEKPKNAKTAAGDTQGGDLITVYGRSFGTLGHDGKPASEISVYINGETCSDVEMLSSTILTCVTPPGIGSGHPVMVRVGGEGGRMSVAAKMPNLSSSSADDIVDSGGSDGRCSNDRSISCLNDSACDGGKCEKPVPQLSPQVYSYLPPAISKSEKIHGAAGEVVTIHGKNFGTKDSAPQALIAGIFCEITRWRSNNEVTCKVPNSVGINRPVVVVVGGQQSEVVNSFTYKPPVVKSITNPQAIPIYKKTKGDPTPAFALTIQGENFGTVNSGLVCLIGDEECNPTTWISPTYLTCVPPPGFGANRKVTVVSGGQSGTKENMISYAAPKINSIDPSVGTTRGGDHIYIAMENIPHRAGVASVSVTIGGKECTDVSLHAGDFSDGDGQKTGISCTTPPGAGARQPVVVAVAGQQNTPSKLSFFDYYAPILHSIKPNIGSLTGNEVVTISGANFGPINGPPAHVFINSKECLPMLPGGVCTLPSGIVQGVVQVKDSTKFSVGELIKIDEEFLSVVSISATSGLTVARGQHASFALRHAKDTAISVMKKNSEKSGSLSKAVDENINVFEFNASPTFEKSKTGIHLQIDDEIVTVTKDAGNDKFEVKRGEFDTVATAHGQNAIVVELTISETVSSTTAEMSAVAPSRCNSDSDCSTVDASSKCIEMISCSNKRSQPCTSSADCGGSASVCNSTRKLHNENSHKNVRNSANADSTLFCKTPSCEKDCDTKPPEMCQVVEVQIGNQISQSLEMFSFAKNDEVPEVVGYAESLISQKVESLSSIVDSENPNLNGDNPGIAIIGCDFEKNDSQERICKVPKKFAMKVAKNLICIGNAGKQKLGIVPVSLKTCNDMEASPCDSDTDCGDGVKCSCVSSVGDTDSLEASYCEQFGSNESLKSKCIAAVDACDSEKPQAGPLVVFYKPDETGVGDLVVAQDKDGNLITDIDEISAWAKEQQRPIDRLIREEKERFETHNARLIQK
eukprot:g3510.t1